MKIALPVSDNKICMHFGHCERFEVFNVDDKIKKINGSETFDAPPHQPGLLPGWLADKGVNCVIAGGMGSRAISLFKENGVDVITGAHPGYPADILKEYLEGSLKTGENVCDH